MSENTFAFRRLTRAVLVPVAETATQIPIDPAIYAGLNAFYVLNPNQVYVSLRGTSMNAAGVAPGSALLAQSDGADWLFQPHFSAVFSTQQPVFMSALALAMPGYPLTGGPYESLRVYYGQGT